MSGQFADIQLPQGRYGKQIGSNLLPFFSTVSSACRIRLDSLRIRPWASRLPFYLMGRCSVLELKVFLVQPAAAGCDLRHIGL